MPSDRPSPPERSDSDRLLYILRQAQDEVERKVSGELKRSSAAQQATRRELEEARSRAAELQRDLEKMTTQKNYVADAFENSRKEASKLRTENQLQNEELVRLRAAVQDLQAERQAVMIGRKVVDADLAALEVERDVIARALGAATKQLFGKQQLQMHGDASPSAKGRASAVKKARPPSGKASPRRDASPGAGTLPTGGKVSDSRRTSVSTGRL